YGSQALLSAMQQQYTQNALQQYVFEAQMIGAGGTAGDQPHGGFEAKCGSGPGDERPQEGNPQVHPPVAPQDLLRGFSMAPSILIPELPRFVPPMLAKPGAPFDSSEHLFEIKWDGTRVLAFVESHNYRLVNRHRADVTERYPELKFLNDLSAGTVLDGEVVVL